MPFLLIILQKALYRMTKKASGYSKANQLHLQELIVDLYNVAKSANAVKRTTKPSCAPLLATNFDLPRYVRLF